MHFKLIIAFVGSNQTEGILEATRLKGATGSTVISQARGEGLEHHKSFLVSILNHPKMFCFF